MFIDPELMQQLDKSTCFGVAHEPTAKECRKCDLQQECMAKTQGNKVFDLVKTLKPETKEAMKEAREQRESEFVKPKRRKKKELPKGMPNTRKMTIEELWTLLEERGGTCKEYDSEPIQRMRLVMAIKETYE